MKIQILRADVEKRLEEARADVARLRSLVKGYEVHAYYIPIHTAVQIAEQRVDALLLALSEAR